MCICSLKESFERSIKSSHLLTKRVFVGGVALVTSLWSIGILLVSITTIAQFFFDTKMSEC